MSPAIPTGSSILRGEPTGRRRVVSRWLVALVVSSIVVGCAAPPPSFRGVGIDVTEDLYHRMRAGLFLPDREPLICRLYHLGSQPGDRPRLAPHSALRVSWELGSFQVRSDGHGQVVLYLDEMAAWGHLRLTTSERVSVARSFLEYPVHPVLLDGGTRQVMAVPGGLSSARIRVAERLRRLLVGASRFSGDRHRAGETIPFELASLPARLAQEVVGRGFEMQILDASGQPVPYGLLRLQWEEGGRISLQSDSRGRLSVRFEADLSDHEVWISADIKPRGQSLIEDDYEATSQPVPGGSIRLSR
ncbi:MAG: hypothetical protein MI919_39890 [Holophagales bacterium]|nr:hypothetical protein [Holophagales bacterium]